MAAAKFHLSPEGPAPCTASERPCKYGNELHFSTREEAEAAHQENLTREHGLLGKATKRRTEGEEATQKAPEGKRALTAKELFAFAQESPLVNAREDQHGLFVLKYHRKVFYDNLWDEKLVDCRGAVFTASGELAQLPFTKIYNDRVEANAPEILDSEEVTVARKVNGFMGALSYHEGKPLWSTTGSTTSPFVKMFKESTPPEVLAFVKQHPEKTYLFEVVHPSDPHIVPEEPGIYLLGARKKELGSPVELIAPEDLPAGVHPVPFERKPMGEVRSEVRGVKHEGFVVYTDDGRSTKLKSPHYLTTKFLARGNINKITGPGAKERVDEEYYPLLDAIRAEGEAYGSLSEQERIAWCSAFLERQAAEGAPFRS